MRRVNGWLTVFWIAMIPISVVTGWISSVTYVAALSLWALVSGHWSAWQAARVEVRQEQEALHAERAPLEQRVVDKLVEETTLDVAGVRSSPPRASTPARQGCLDPSHTRSESIREMPLADADAGRPPTGTEGADRVRKT
jgi:hypothetical protein